MVGWKGFIPSAAQVAAAVKADPPSTIKSFQRGTFMLPTANNITDVTVNEVVMAKAELTLLGTQGSGLSTLRLYNQTTIRGEKYTPVGNERISYELVERY